MNRSFTICVALMILLLGRAKAQQLIILKDSVQIGEIYYVLEEPKLADQYSNISMDIYKKVRNSSILSGYFSAPPEQRLKAKKDTLKALIAEGGLREAGYGFEHYELHYDNAGLLNLSVSVQSYGSPFESSHHYCFDLSSGKEIGKSLFVNSNGLLKAIKAKLSLQKPGIGVNSENLNEFEIITDGKETLKGVRFFIADTKNYRNSGYEIFEVYFSQKEIIPYFSAEFKKRLLGL